MGEGKAKREKGKINALVCCYRWEGGVIRITDINGEGGNFVTLRKRPCEYFLVVCLYFKQFLLFSTVDGALT